MDNDTVVLEGELNPVSDRVLNETLDHIFFRQKLYDWIYLAVCVCAAVFFLAVYGFDPNNMLLFIVLCACSLLAVFFVAVSLPKRKKACADQIRKRATSGHYIYYQDRRVCIREDSTSTVRYDEFFKAVELKNTWLLYIGEKNAWEVMMVSSDMFLEQGHYEKALELMLSKVPEKNIKHRK